MTSTDWTPAVALDLEEASNAGMVSTINEFHAKFKDVPLTPIELKDGWHTITPQIAEHLLRSTGLNRKVSLQAVQYYARQMTAGDWQKTGQPIIINDKGEMVDAQHRCWGCYLSNTPFESYVVTGVPQVEHLFAYIDNGKTRTGSDALYTAGINGLSSIISSTVRIARYYDAEAFTVMKKLFVPRATPLEVLQYAATHPRLSDAARLQLGEYKSATTVIHHRDVAVFSAWKILETSGEDVLDEFMSQLGGSEPVADGSPIALLRKKFADDANSDDPMPKHHALAYVTKVFNAVRLGQTIKRLNLTTNERWPLFTDQTAETEAAA